MSRQLLSLGSPNLSRVATFVTPCLLLFVMPMIGPEFETIQKAGRMQTAEPSSLKTSALETASSGASPQKQRGHSEVLDRLATGAAKPELSMEVSSAKRKPKQLDYDVNCPHCGRVNPYDYSSCDPVLPRICQGDEE